MSRTLSQQGMTTARRAGVTPVPAAAPRRQRLRADERREDLLDAAAAVLAAVGPAGLTMEGIAAHAGVDKALPYRHFANAAAVLVQLHARFNRQLGAAVLAAVADHDDLEGRVRAVTTAIFDVARDNRSLLALLGGEGTSVEVDAEERAVVERFLVGLMTESFDVPRKEALATAEVVVGALAAAVRAWGRGRGSRRALEQRAVGAILGALAARP